MIYIVAILTGLAGAITGWLATAFASLIVGSAVGVSDLGGALGLIAFYGIGPVGGLAGLVLGLGLGLQHGGHLTSFGAVARREAVMLVAIAALAAGAFVQI